MQWPSWSRDGRWIAFVGDVSRDNYPGDIWIARNDGTPARRLTHGNADDRFPVWLSQTKTGQKLFGTSHHTTVTRARRLAVVADGGVLAVVSSALRVQTANRAVSVELSDLGVLVPAGFEFSDAVAINERGEIAGEIWAPAASARGVRDGSRSPATKDLPNCWFVGSARRPTVHYSRPQLKFELVAQGDAELADRRN